MKRQAILNKMGKTLGYTLQQRIYTNSKDVHEMMSNIISYLRNED